MSSYSSVTPKNNRRMTLSSLHSNSTPKPANALPVKPKVDNASKNLRLPPKGRQSMIPRVGRENMNIPSTPNNSRPGTGIPSSSSMGSSTAANRRRSIGGGDNSVPSSAIRRQSGIPISSGSSVSSVGQKPDPRPINDKAYQHQCMKDLLTFLQEMGYEYPISLKTLSRPSAKDFTNMTTFLLRQIDKDFQRGGMKFEDEVALNFKCMGYPYPISKTALVAAGTPHTWPALLSALTWLMHQLQCKGADIQRNELENETIKDFSSIGDLETQTDKAFFQYMGQSYSAFMRGDTEALEALETAFMQRFEHDDAFLAQAVERITDLNASIVERINEIGRQYEDLPEYTKKRESYATDVEQFHDLYRQMEDHKKQFEQKVRERTSELAVANEKLEKMTKHINDLKKSVSEQEYSVEDVVKMESEISALNEAADRAIQLKDQKRKALFASETELQAVCNDLDTKIAEFNAKISDLRLNPDLGFKLGKAQASINKEMLIHSDLQQSIGIDLVGSVQPTVKASKNEYESKVDQSKIQYQRVVEEINHLEDSNKEVDAKLKIFGDKLSKSEQMLESERKTQEALHDVRVREVDALDKKITSLQDPVALEEQMAAYERQCAELEALRREREENNMSQKRSVLLEINNLCQLMEDHDSYLTKQVAEVKTYWDEQTKKIGEIVVPTNLEK